MEILILVVTFLGPIILLFYFNLVAKKWRIKNNLQSKEDKLRNLIRILSFVLFNIGIFIFSFLLSGSTVNQIAEESFGLMFKNKDSFIFLPAFIIYFSFPSYLLNKFIFNNYSDKRLTNIFYRIASALIIYYFFFLSVYAILTVV